MKESYLTKKLATKAKAEPGVWVRKTWGGPQGAGWPDLVGLCRGVFLGLEVKLPGREKTLTALQKQTLLTIRKNGGVAMVVTNEDDLQYALTLAHLMSYMGEYVVDPKTGCHIRKGDPTKRGQIGIQRNGKRIRRNAPRIIAAVYHGLDIRNKSSKKSESLGACHTCDNPACINPDHIYIGTQKENIMDMVKRGRNSHVPKPGRKPKLSMADVPEIHRLYKRGLTQAEIGKRYGVTGVLISKVLRGQGRYQR